MSRDKEDPEDRMSSYAGRVSGRVTPTMGRSDVTVFPSVAQSPLFRTSAVAGPFLLGLSAGFKVDW